MLAQKSQYQANGYKIAKLSKGRTKFWKIKMRKDEINYLYPNIKSRKRI